MLIISVLIIAIVNIFALTNIQTYYTLLYQHGKVSSVKAFGTYSIVENSSMAVGPIVFSYILANDISFGMKILAFVIFGCTILFTVTSALYHKKSKIRGFFRRSNDTYGAALKSKGKSERKKNDVKRSYYVR
jgi:MFS-type transporter involved in bile tolerance (Atg22 family)